MKKYLSLLTFIFVVASVCFFIFKAIQENESGSSEQLTGTLDSLERLKNEGLKKLDVSYVDGRPFSLNDIKAPIVVLNFWASWCGPCVEEIPSFIELVKTYNGQVVLLAVSLDSDLNQMNQFLKGFDVSDKNIHILLDPEFVVAQEIGTTKLPESYIFGTDRKLLRKVSGSIDWMAPETQGFIQNALRSHP